LFADPDFDGDPIPASGDDDEGNLDKPPGYPPYPDNQDGESGVHEPRVKYRVNDVDVTILNERVQYYDKDGKLITESVTDYSKRNILGEYSSLDEFNLHTVVRMPHSVFAPYTGITTNILFFENTSLTVETWFYRLDMPDGYKNFSKTKPMKLEHFAPAMQWWNNREEITVDGFDKAKRYTAEELSKRNYNIDLCGFPHEEEELLPPHDLIVQYKEKRASLNTDIDRILAKIESILEKAP